MVIRHMLWVKVTAFWIVRDSVDFIRSWTFKNRAKEDRDSKKAILPWWWPYHKEISPRTKCEGGSPSVVKWTCPISPTYKYKRNSEFPEQTIPEIERIRKQDNPIYDQTIQINCVLPAMSHYFLGFDYAPGRLKLAVTKFRVQLPNLTPIYPIFTQNWQKHINHYDTIPVSEVLILKTVFLWDSLK